MEGGVQRMMKAQGNSSSRLCIIFGVGVKLPYHRFQIEDSSKGKNGIANGSGNGNAAHLGTTLALSSLFQQQFFGISTPYPALPFCIFVYQ